MGRPLHAIAGVLILAACGTPDRHAEVAPRDATDASVPPPPVVHPPPPPLPPAPEGAGALSAIDRLPVLDLAFQSRHSSSYDRTGGNVDYGGSLGTDALGDLVLLDARGPGCVYRLWMTNFLPDAR